MPVAQLLADGDDVSISGPHADWINPDFAIVDPETGERITRADGAERWARLQPDGTPVRVDVPGAPLATRTPIKSTTGAS